MRFAGSQLEESHAPTLSSPNLVNMYLDARPASRVRAFVKGRLTYDPMTTSFLPGILPEPDETKVLLDQVWLKFDVARTLFLTVGKQHVRWGASKLWNPVDMVNPTRRDPLALYDERTGVPMLKVQLPIESLGWNFIALDHLDDAGKADDIGGALRLEMLFGQVAVGLSGVARQGADGKVGLDLSAGIWEFDVTAEAALTFTDEAGHESLFDVGDRHAVAQVSAGIDYTFKINDEDYAGVALEYFWNPDGYASKDDYLPAFLSGSATPFYLGQHYGAVMFLLPSPGSWDDVSFTLANIGNFSDQSFLSRIDVSIRVLTKMSVQLYTAVHYGTRGGEFRFAVDEVPLPGMEEFKLAPQLLDFGVNLRVDL